MNKNRGHFLAFTEQWFIDNQRALVWLLNSPILKYWFRWILRIHHDVPSYQYIHSIGPNRFSYALSLRSINNKWTITQTTDFRTHPKYGKRIYFAFRPIWWVIHFWDWAVADRFVPQWSYGFDTLTVNPAAGVNSPIDGYVLNNRATWADAIGNTAGTTVQDSLEQGVMVDARLLGDTTFNVIRSFFLFDTSALTSGATISAAVFSVKPHDAAGGVDNDGGNVCIVASTPAANNALALGDFDQLGSTVFAQMAVWTVSDATYRDFTLDANGRANISKTSISKFGARQSLDINNTTPTGTNQALCRYADYAGTTHDPKLVVTYTASTDYPLTAAQGSFTLTGQTALFSAGFHLTSVLGSFVLTGQNALFSYGKTIIAAVGSFVLTGQDAVVTSARTLVAALGQFTLTGQTASLLKGYLLTAARGLFTLTGQTVALLVNGTAVVWSKLSKSSAPTYTKISKSSTSWDETNKSSDPTWTKQDIS